jgi:hypothetical protein
MTLEAPHYPQILTINPLYICAITVLNATFLFLHLPCGYSTCFDLTRPSSGVGTLAKIVALSFY